MHAHFHNNLNASASLALAGQDYVNTNPGGTAPPGDTVLVDDNGAALVDDFGNAVSVN